MTTYEIQYKCYLAGELASILLGFHPGTPVLRYRYRKLERGTWERQEWIPLDLFATRLWASKYYDGDPDSISAADRIRIMRDILDEEYGGNLGNYIRAMVEFEIISDLIDKEEDREVLDIALSFVTNGWRRTGVDLIRKNRDETDE